MKQFRQFIVENQDRLQYVKDKFFERMVLIVPPAIAESRFNLIVAADPSRNKQYVQWICNLVVRANIRIEDLPKITEDLTVFERVKARMPADQRDINRFKEYQNLYDAITPYMDSKSNKQVKREEIDELRAEITTLYRGSEGGIYVPLTEKASQFLGRGTRWCTAATGGGCAFKSYSTATKMLIVFIDANGTKVQLHAPRGDLVKMYHESGAEFMTVIKSSFQFADDADRTITTDAALKMAPIVRKGLEIPQAQGAFLVNALFKKDIKAITWLFQHMPALKAAVKADADEVLEMFEGRHGAFMKVKYKGVFEMYTTVKGL